MGLLLTAATALVLFIINLPSSPTKDPDVIVVFNFADLNERARIDTSSSKRGSDADEDANEITPMDFSEDGTPLDIKLAQQAGEPGDAGVDPDLISNLPSSMGARCDYSQRIQRLIETGGSPETDHAILKALRWLQSEQNEDGSWSDEHQVSMTGLALLAYLGHCDTVESEEFGETVMSAIVYLTDIAMKYQGRIGTDFGDTWAYDQSIAAYALCEAFTFSKVFHQKIPNLEESTQSSIDWLISAQAYDGGWNYRYKRDARSDNSINAWHLQALKAAKATGLTFEGIDKSISRGVTVVISTQDPNGGFSYNTVKTQSRGGLYLTPTGPAALAIQLHQGINHPMMKPALEHLFIHQKHRYSKGAELYEHYYIAQFMMNNGSDSWQRYREGFIPRLLNAQRDDGHWTDVKPGRYSEGKIYDTALAALVLETHFRFLPGTSRVRH